MGIKSAFITLLIMIAAIAANSFFIVNSVNEMYHISCDGPDDTIEDISKKHERISKLFASREMIISLSVSHEDLTDIEMLLYEIRGAIDASDLNAATVAKSRLDNALLHLGRLSSLNIESIL